MCLYELSSCLRNFQHVLERFLLFFYFFWVKTLFFFWLKECAFSRFFRKKSIRLKKMFTFLQITSAEGQYYYTKFTFFTVHSLKKISPTTWIPCRKIKSSTSAGYGRRATTTPTFAAITLSRMTWTRLNWALTWTQTTTPTTAYSAMNSIWIISLHPEAILWLNLTVLLADSIRSVWGNRLQFGPTLES